MCVNEVGNDINQISFFVYRIPAGTVSFAFSTLAAFTRKVKLAADKPNIFSADTLWTNVIR